MVETGKPVDSPSIHLPMNFKPFKHWGILLCSLFSVGALSAQSVEYPFNPDSNGDNMIYTADLIEILTDDIAPGVLWFGLRDIIRAGIGCPDGSGHGQQYRRDPSGQHTPPLHRLMRRRKADGQRLSRLVWCEHSPQ